MHFRLRRRHPAAILVAFALMVITVGPAAADTSTISVTVATGALTISTGDINFGQFTLDGTDKAAEATPTWTALDARGSGLGWNLTIASTDLTVAGSPDLIIDISEPDQELRIRLADSWITTIAGNDRPTTRVATSTAVPSGGPSALKVVSAAVGTGMGTYLLSPSLTLGIPAEQHHGDYSGMALVTISSAP